MQAISRPTRPTRPLTHSRRTLPNHPARRQQRTPHNPAVQGRSECFAPNAQTGVFESKMGRVGRELPLIRLDLRRDPQSGTAQISPSLINPVPASRSPNWGHNALGLTLLVGGFWVMMAATAVLST